MMYFRTPEDGAKRQEVFPPEWIPGPIRLPVIGSAYKYLPGGRYINYIYCLPNG